MKVAIIAGYSPSLLNFRGPLLRALRERGHEVVALAPSDDRTVIRTLAQMGVTFLPIRLRRASTNPLRDIGTLYSFVKQLERAKPDKVLSYTPKPAIWGSIAARMVGVPEIYALITGLGRAFGDNVEHSSLKQRMLNETVRGLYRVGLASCRGVLFQNPDDRMLFRQLHLTRRDQSTIVTAGSGVDVDYFGYAPPPTGTRQVFLTLTRLLASKGVPEFVAAASKLKPRYPHSEFRVVGPREYGLGGISDEALKQWASLGHVTFAPSVADVRAELKRASVYVLASSYREGVPRSVLEALSTGRAVITTDTPGCRETIVPGRNGFLVPPRDARALAESMERFILAPELANAMGLESRALAISRFDVHKVNSQILSFMGL